MLYRSILSNAVCLTSIACHNYAALVMLERVAVISSLVLCLLSSRSPAPLILKPASLRQLFCAVWHASLLVQSKPSPPKAAH
jgi:hypothetical protein